jgi:hypothetical protein
MAEQKVENLHGPVILTLSAFKFLVIMKMITPDEKKRMTPASSFQIFPIWYGDLTKKGSLSQTALASR